MHSDERGSHGVGRVYHIISLFLFTSMDVNFTSVKAFFLFHFYFHGVNLFHVSKLLLPGKYITSMKVFYEFFFKIFCAS